MRYDWLLEPISAEAPCGPDLDEIGDEKYLNYVLPVASRIPARFYKADTDEPVDRSAIKLKEELPVIADLLRKAATSGCFASKRGCRALPATCPGSPTASWRSPGLSSGSGKTSIPRPSRAISRCARTC